MRINKVDNNKYAKEYRNKNSEKIKEYRNKNSEKNKEYQKKYFNDNKEIIKEKQNKYNIENKEKIKDTKKLYSESNRETILEKKKEYYNNNKEKIKEYNKEYFKNNKPELNKKRNIYLKNKISTDDLFKLKIKIRTIIYKSLKKKKYIKKESTEEILGCSFEIFKNYIEYQFESWMNWANYVKYNGNYKYGWDIDHIIELKIAETDSDILKLNYYTNLRTLDSKINRVDRNFL